MRNQRGTTEGECSGRSSAILVLAAPYAESMSEIAVLHTADEKPDEAAKRALTALLLKTIQVKALLVADGRVKSLGSLLSVNVSLESSDSLAMQRAVLTLGNPAAGMKWRESCFGRR